MLAVTWIREKPVTWSEPIDGGRLPGYLPSGFDLRGGNLIELNGRVLKGREAQTYRPKAGDRLTLVDLPAGFALSAALFAFVKAPILATTLLAGFAFSASGLFNRPPSRRRSDDSSPSRSFEGIQNTTGPGTVIPFGYGELRVGGHIVESFAEPTFDFADETNANVTVISPTTRREGLALSLSTRIVIGWGPLESISAFQIDANDVAGIPGLQIETVLGTKTQKVLDGFSHVKTPQANGTTVTASGGPIEQSTVNPALTAEVILKFPSGLFELDSNGNFLQRAVSVTVEFKRDSEAYGTPYKTVTITGASQQAMRVFIQLPPFGTPDVHDVRITRNTADNVDPTIEDDFEFEKLQVIEISAARAHPGLAQIGFRQLPQDQAQPVAQTYTALVRFFSDIRVYTDPSTFTKQWTRTVAWCCAHWLTHPVVGPGRDYDYGDLILDQFIRWAEWGNEQVPDGRGGEHRRCQFDMYFDQPMRGTDILRLFEQAGQARLIEKGGRVGVFLLKDAPTVWKFSEGGYLMETLRYSFIPKENRPSRIHGNFVNAERGYRRDTLPQEDPQLADGERYVERNANYWGIVRPPQLARTLTQQVNMNRVQDREIRFRAWLEGLNISAGDVFALATATGAIGVANGRILRVSSDNLKLELDQEVTLDPAKTYEVLVQHALDGRLSSKYLSNVVADTTNWIEVSNAVWNRDPKKGDEYSLGEISLGWELYQCIRRALAERFRVDIIARPYSDAMLDDTLVTVPASTDAVAFLDPLEFPASVEDVFAESHLVKDSAGNTVRVIDVWWNPPGLSDAQVAALVSQGYILFWREVGDSNYRRLGSTKTNYFRIAQDVKASTSYEIRIYSQHWGYAENRAVSVSVST